MRLGRLSLRRSRFRFLNLCDAEIDGPLDLTEVSGVQERWPSSTRKQKPLAVCFINARDIYINGGLDLSGSKLRGEASPPVTRRNAKFPPVTDYALRLTHANIQGSLHFQDDFVAWGGVTISAAQVRGSVSARGAQLFGMKRDALNAQNARIGGALLLGRTRSEKDRSRPSFRSFGTIWLRGAKIENGLHVKCARIYGRSESTREDDDLIPDVALDGQNLTVGTNVSLRSATILGAVSFANCNVNGDFDCQEADVRFSHKRAPAVSIRNGSIAGEFSALELSVIGGVDLQGVTIGGDCVLDGARLSTSKDSVGYAIQAKNARIGDDALLRASMTDTHSFPFWATGPVDFTGADVQGSLQIEGVRLEPLTSQSSDPIALKAERMQIGGSVTIAGRGCPIKIEGEVDFSRAEVGRNFECSKATLRNDPERSRPDLRVSRVRRSSALFARDIQVHCDLRLIDSTFVGDVNLERANVEGELLWSEITFRSTRSDKEENPLKFDLDHVRVGSQLQARNLALLAPTVVGLAGAKVSSLATCWPEGWGGGIGVDPQEKGSLSFTALDIDGLEYDRIERLTKESDEESNARARAAHRSEREAARDFVDWLECQTNSVGKPEGFLPQPYRQLARILRAQGDEDLARLISFAEQKRRRHPRKRSKTLSAIFDSPAVLIPRRIIFSPLAVLRFVGRRCWGLLFGYGLKPQRAFATLIAYIALGTVGVWFAHRKGLLIERAVPVAVLSSQHEPDDGQEGASQALFANWRSWVASPFLSPSRFRAMELLGTKETSADLACVDAANNYWDDAVYAVDIILPFIPLHEETKCEILPDNRFLPVAARFLRDIYAIVGWLVSSLTFLTASGVLRRSDEGEL